MANIQITHRDMESSEAVDAAIREKYEKLVEHCPELLSCHVVVEQPHRRHRKGSHFHVRVDLVVPGAELVVGRDPAQADEYEDFHVALRDAFLAARRELQRWSDERHRHVKAHTLRAPNGAGGQ